MLVFSEVVKLSQMVLMSVLFSAIDLIVWLSVAMFFLSCPI